MLYVIFFVQMNEANFKVRVQNKTVNIFTTVSLSRIFVPDDMLYDEINPFDVIIHSSFILF